MSTQSQSISNSKREREGVNIKHLFSFLILCAILGIFSQIFTSISAGNTGSAIATKATSNAVAIMLASGATVMVTEIPYDQLTQVPVSASDVRTDLGDFNPNNKCLQDFINNGFTLIRAVNGEGQAIRHFLQKGSVIVRVDFTRVSGKIIEVGTHIVEHFGRAARYFTLGSPKKNRTFVKKSSKPLRPYTHHTTGCTVEEWLSLIIK
jgi:hypothetical protein